MVQPGHLDAPRRLESLKVRYSSVSSTTAQKPLYPEDPFAGVKRENIFVVRINSADKAFLRKRGKDAIFSFQADRGSSYGAFCHMQSLLLRIYDEVRNEKAQEEYGKSLEELTAAERSRINYMLPICITEAEMKG